MLRDILVFIGVCAPRKAYPLSSDVTTYNGFRDKLPPLPDYEPDDYGMNRTGPARPVKPVVSSLDDMKRILRTLPYGDFVQHVEGMFGNADKETLDRAWAYATA